MRGQGGGASCKVSPQTWQTFKEALLSSEQQHFNSRDLQQHFFELSGGVTYSEHYWPRLLRENMSMYYYKPQPRDYRQPEEAEEQLKQRFSACLDALQVMGKDVSQMAFGFADESALQLHSNNARFWCLSPHLPRKVNSNRETIKFFGFYALRGQSVLETMGGGKSEEFKDMLKAIKQANADKEGVILFWDNARAHKAVEAYAWQLGIYIIPLPVYSPNLNPIERLWKACKRWTTQQGMARKTKDLLSHFSHAFNNFKVQTSFAEGWCKNMEEIIYKNCPVFQPVGAYTPIAD